MAHVSTTAAASQGFSWRSGARGLLGENNTEGKNSVLTSESPLGSNTSLTSEAEIGPLHKAGE